MGDKNISGCASPEFDCDNPISLDEIEKHLWLGSFTAATDVATLKEHNITHILTLDICPLPVRITELPFLTTKYIQVSDTPKEDLLYHFEDCFSFIDEALKNNTVILVHCYFGVSRSATIVIGYVMRKYRLSLTPAFERVKSERSFVYPNAGFMTQLRLFHKMGWKIDQNHEKFKLYRLRLAADNVRKAKILPQNCMDLVKADPALIQSNPEPSVYRCKKCRRVIAAKTNLITHTPATSVQRKESRSSTSRRARSAESELNTPDDDAGHAIDASEPNLLERMASQLYIDSKASEVAPRCAEIIFVEPLAWMTDISKQTQGKLNCPKCQSKLGNFTWINGCNCPCGKNVAPAFYLIPSKVELSHAVQNVEMTV